MCMCMTVDRKIIIGKRKGGKVQFMAVEERKEGKKPSKFRLFFFHVWTRCGCLYRHRKKRERFFCFCKQALGGDELQ